jgi:hypothetical protein
MPVKVPTLMLLTNLVATAAFAEPNKEHYELQERCGKQAAKVFEKFNDGDTDNSITNTKDGQTITSYRNHYNPTLNKCFFLETTSILAYNASPKYTASMYILSDVSEHKEYGSFYKRSDLETPVQCVVNGKSCHSEAEWELLIAPFMGDAP